MKLRIVATLFGLFLLAACGQPTDDGVIFRTADPNVSLFMPVASVPQPDVQPVTVPSEEVGECIVKGNINSAGEKIAHSPGQANYNQTIIDPSKGEQCFATLAEAQAAGWRAAQR